MARDHFVVLADTHVHQERSGERDGVRLVASFEKVIREILALNPRPSGIIVAGDCAQRGQPGDYSMLRELTEPLQQKGIPWHMALGNHDRRECFLAAFPEAAKRAAPVPDRFVSVVETKCANWFLLDSLVANSLGGRLGEAQLAWLAKALDARPGKPALLVAHHQLEPSQIADFPLKPDSIAPKDSGLMDADALLKVIVPRRQVKAYFSGHVHRWKRAQYAGIHLIQLPTTASPGRPAFIAAELRPAGATLVLHPLDPKHATHLETIELSWR